MLSYVPCNVFLLVAQEVLEVPIIEEELTNAIHAVVKSFSAPLLKQNGYMVFY